jgi:hypothetical protein
MTSLIIWWYLPNEISIRRDWLEDCCNGEIYHFDYGKQEYTCIIGASHISRKPYPK